MFPPEHPINNFPGCKFERDLEESSDWNPPSADPSLHAKSVGICEYRVRHFKSFCNVGGYGSESGEPEIGVCQVLGGIDNAYDEQTRDLLLPQAKWGHDYVVRAQIKIHDWTNWTDHPVEYSTTYENPVVLSDQTVSPGTCFPFLFVNLDDGYAFEQKRFEKHATQLMGIKVRCLSEIRCKELSKGKLPAKACYGKEFGSITVQ